MTPTKETYGVWDYWGTPRRAITNWEKWPTIARVCFNGNSKYAVCKTITLHLADDPRLCWLQVNYHSRQAAGYRYARNMDLLGFPTWLERC